MGSLPPRRAISPCFWIPGTIITILFLISGGCASVANQRKSPENTEQPTLIWPEPPLKPRIRFVQTLAGEADLGRKITGRESFREFITGEKPALSHLYQPRDVVVSDDGQRVYVTDYALYLVFLFDLENRTVTHFGKEKPFARPFGIALDAEENLYVVEQSARRIRVLDRFGNEIRIISHPDIVRPTDIALDRKRDRIYLVDPASKDAEEHVVKIFNLSGEYVGKIGQGKGSCEGCLFFPTFVAVDEAGRVYVSNTLNARVDVFDADGKFLKTIGERGTSFGQFDKPKGVALDSFGNIYVVDSGWSNVQIFNQKGEVLLFFGGRGKYPGLLRNPTGIAIDSKNRIYVADYLNYRVTVYELINTDEKDSFLDPEELARND